MARRLVETVAPTELRLVNVGDRDGDYAEMVAPLLRDMTVGVERIVLKGTMDRQEVFDAIADKHAPKVTEVEAVLGWGSYRHELNSFIRFTALRRLALGGLPLTDALASTLPPSLRALHLSHPDDVAIDGLTDLTSLGTLCRRLADPSWLPSLDELDIRLDGYGDGKPQCMGGDAGVEVLTAIRAHCAERRAVLYLALPSW